MSTGRCVTSLGAAISRRRIPDMVDLLFVLLSLGVFVLLALVVKAVEKL